MIIYILIILFSLHLTLLYGQIAPEQSPCPDLFQYIFDGNEWYGIIEVPNPSAEHRIHLQITLSLAAQLFSNYVGVLELFSTKEEAAQLLIRGKHIRYRVRFPIPSPVPILTSIQYNNQIICSGPAARGEYVTTITLEHSLEVDGPSNRPHYDSAEPDHNDNLNYFIHSHNLSPHPQHEHSDHVVTQPVYPQEQQPQQPLNQYQYEVQTTPAIIQTVAPQTQYYNAEANTVQCGTIDSQFKRTPLVVNGIGTKRGTWPWITALFSNKASTIQFICGGTLISQRTVVTAAHCLKPEGIRLKESELIVFIGRHDIKKWGEEGAEAADPQKLIVHPEYSKGRDFEADIGIVILTRELIYNVYIRPVCMWPDGFNDIREVTGQSGTVVGWGRDENGQLVSPEPKQIQMPIVDELTCLRSDKGFQDLTSNRTFCAGSRDKSGPCNGDSGSGLVIYQNNRWVLRGIVSIAQSNYLNMCNLDLYVVFTDVAKFIPWIKSNME